MRDKTLDPVQLWALAFVAGVLVFACLIAIGGALYIRRHRREGGKKHGKAKD